MLAKLISLFRKPKPEPKPRKVYSDCPCFTTCPCTDTCDRAVYFRAAGIPFESAQTRIERSRQHSSKGGENDK